MRMLRLTGPVFRSLTFRLCHHATRPRGFSIFPARHALTAVKWPRPRSPVPAGPQSLIGWQKGRPAETAHRSARWCRCVQFHDIALCPAHLERLRAPLLCITHHDDTGARFNQHPGSTTWHPAGDAAGDAAEPVAMEVDPVSVPEAAKGAAKKKKAKKEPKKKTTPKKKKGKAVPEPEPVTEEGKVAKASADSAAANAAATVAEEAARVKAEDERAAIAAAG